MMRRAVIGFACAVGLMGAALDAHAASEVLDGFGKNVELSIAVRQIVPLGVTVSYSSDIDVASKVDWAGGTDWRTVLSETVAAKGYEAVFVGDSVRIQKGHTVRQGGSGFVMVPRRGAEPASDAAPIDIVSPAPEMAQVPERVIVPEVVKPASEPVVAAEPLAPVAVEAPAVQAAPVAAHQVEVSTEELWVAEKGKTLRQILEAWSEKAGWNLVWNSKFEYPLVAGATFSGDFVTASSDLVRSMSNVSPVIKASFYKGNRVLLLQNDVGFGN